MSGSAVARIDEIDEIDDGRVLSRPVRFHFGITSFESTRLQLIGWAIGSSTSTTSHRSMTCRRLYLVQRGRATFELDGERVDAPAGTLVFVRPAVKRTAFAEEPGTTIVALGGTPARTRPRAARSGCRSTIFTSQANTPRLPIGDAS